MTQTKAQEPALANLPKPNLYPFRAVSKNSTYTSSNASFNDFLINYSSSFIVALLIPILSSNFFSKICEHKCDYINKIFTTCHPPCPSNTATAKPFIFVNCSLALRS